MSLKRFLNRTLMLIEQGLYETQRAFRTEDLSARALQVTQLEERILMSASPAAVVAAAPVEPAAAISQQDAPANFQETTALTEQQYLDVIADQVLPEAQTTTSATQSPDTQSLELLFLDSSISNLQQMVDDLQQTAAADPSTNREVIVLDASRDGIAQITAALLNYNGIDGLHIVSHGSDGQVQLGSTTLSLDNLDTYRSAISAWQYSMSEDADILIYGCNVAESANGQELLNQLSQLTATDVAASENLTGHADSGGDWQFEYAVGNIESQVVFSQDFQSQWTSTLDAGLVLDDEQNDNVLIIDTSLASTEFERIELVFVDTGVADYQTILTDLQSHSGTGTRLHVALIDSDADGLSQVNDYLTQLGQPLDAIHFITHGTDRAVKFGSTWLDGNAANLRQAEFAQWSGALKSGGDLLFYGCDLASTQAGRDLLGSIAEWTGADIAASETLIGAESLGGNWLLEYNVGEIETQIVVNAALQAEWEGLLATFTVTNTNDSGAGSLRQAILDANALAGHDTIQFAIAGTGVHTINVGSSLTITDAVTIDATSDDSFAANSNRPAIILEGNNSFTGDGFVLTSNADGTTIRGFVIRDFSGDGIEIQAGSDGNTIAGNYIGRLNATGTDAGVGVTNTGSGIRVYGSNTTIGGTNASDRNVIWGNEGKQISLEAGSQATVIQGNWLGSGEDSSSLTVGENTPQRLEVVIVDTATQDYLHLVDDLLSGNDGSRPIDVMILDSSLDGVQQISDLLAGYSSFSIDAVHVVSHGIDGGIKLGGSWLTSDNVSGYADELANWQHALSADADILIYGCDVAATVEGRGLITDLALLTGADIAASDDLTGHADLGGNWVLEFSIGQIDSELVFSAHVMANWYGTLDLTAVGGETLVNGATGSNQQVTPDVGQHLAMDASGRYVVTWWDNRSGNQDIYAKVYNADGSVRVNEFMVHSTQSSAQDWSNVAMADNGNFVVTWSDNRSGTYEVYMRLFNVDGTALTGETMVSTLTGAQDFHSADFAADGSFVVVFQHAADADVYFQRYNASGVALGSNTIVNNLTSGTQNRPDVVVRDDGSFIVTWMDSTNDGSGQGVYARMFNSSGTALANQFLVNTTTAGNQRYSSIDADATGNFVVSWTSANQDGSGDGIYMKRYNAAGTALTGDVLVNTLTANNQRFSHVDMNAAGDFIVTWQDAAADGSGTSVWAQQFDSAGTRIGGQVLVNTTTANNQSTPSVAFHGNSAVVSWMGNGTGDPNGIFLQRYSTTNYSTITVTTTSDTADGDTSSIAALLNNRGADGQISLREAIAAVNASTNGTGGADRILFSIGSGAQTITVTSSDLAALTEAVIIDGSTQSGYSGAPLISIVDGDTRQIGFNLNTGSSGSTIRGLNIQGFGTAGIQLLSSSNTIVGNYIGTNAAGTSAAGNLYGIRISGGDNNIIGGTAVLDRNVISGNTHHGVLVTSSADNTQFLGNFVGLNAAGTSSLANGVDGMRIENSLGTVIGNGTAAGRNIISGNSGRGIYLDNADNTTIQGNYVGTDAAGTADINGTTGNSS